MTQPLSEADFREISAISDRLHTLLLDRVFPAAVPSASVAPAVSPTSPPRLTPADYAEAAAQIPCDLPAVYAVAEVESRGAGFEGSRPIILFEPHVFSRLTQHRFDATYGGVSYPKWGMKPYPKGQTANWDRLLYAAKLDHAAAYQSASYGMFQLMGFNFKICGFSDIDSFVAAMHCGEREQLLAFVQFVRGNHLDDELREHRWADFALRYNGEGYAKNHYDTRLAAAHASHAQRLSA